MVVNNKHIIPGKLINQHQLNQSRNEVQFVKSDFSTILQEKLQNQTGIKFSKHAELRLRARNINITPSQLTRIRNGIDKAEEKGVRDSLILVDNLVLIINVKNKTVVTAVTTNDLKENVFTNIDGAVIV